MLKKYLLILFLMATYSSYSQEVLQAPKINTDVPGFIFGDKKFDRGIYIKKTSDGNMLTSGYTASFSNNGDNDFYLIKTDIKGNKIWDITYGGAGSDLGFGFEEIGNNEGYLAIGFSESYGTDEDIVLTRISANGEIVWIKNLPRKGRERCWSIKKVSDGNFMVVGQTQNLETKVYYGLMTKIDIEGNILWQKTYGDMAYNRIYYCVENSDNDFIIMGITKKDSLADNIGLILKINNRGDLLNSYFLDSLKNTTPHSIFYVSKKEIMVMGYAQMDTAAQQRSVYMALLDAKGNLKWEKGHYEKGMVNHSLSAVVTRNGSVLIAGYTRPLNDRIWNAAVWSFNKNGKFNWKKEYGGPQIDQLYTISEFSKRQFIITGHTYSIGKGDADLWILPIDIKGNPIN